VLNQHCAALGRNPSQITRSISTWISIAEDSAQAARWDNLHITAGNPDEVTMQLEAYRAAGVQHFQLRFIDYPRSTGLELFLSKVLPRLA
jgi:alkanesulfonate monooxygenase SsuD/methylene tetrahydromethanopterin reductase-like flavin-dependent oxidoreductase (luciferase family)